MDSVWVPVPAVFSVVGLASDVILKLFRESRVATYSSASAVLGGNPVDSRGFVLTFI